MIRRKPIRKDVIRAAPTRNACGKVAYWQRQMARRAAAGMAGEHVRPYRCDDCSLWHLGHLPKAVINGEVTADEWYRHGDAEPATT